MMTFAILGGILLNIGAFLTLRGMIYRSVIAFLLADLCWVAMAWERGDYLGMAFILLGVIFGVLAFAKMRNGKMEKELQKSE